MLYIMKKLNSKNALKIRANSTGLLLVIISALVLNLSACSPAPIKQDAQPSVQQHSPVSLNCVETYSEKKLFCVSLKSKIEPPPINRIHSWVLHIVDEKGKPVENANILVYGGMPAHKHGFPTNPKVTENLGNGDFLVEGVKFSMHGEWEMWLTITTDSGSDKAVIKLAVS